MSFFQRLLFHWHSASFFPPVTAAQGESPATLAPGSDSLAKAKNTTTPTSLEDGLLPEELDYIETFFLMAGQVSVELNPIRKKSKK